MSDYTEDLWGSLEIARFIYRHPSFHASDESLPRMFRRLKAKYENSAEPLPVFKRRLPRKWKTRAWWSMKTFIIRWEAAVAEREELGTLWDKH